MSLRIGAPRTIGRSHASEQKPPAQPAELASVLVEKYIEITSLEREWPPKTELRKRSELREFLEICGDKPINAYGQGDGVKFKDIESTLPLYRQQASFKGLSLIDAAKKAAELRNKGQDVEFLSPLTINDKIIPIFVTRKSRHRGQDDPLIDSARPILSRLPKYFLDNSFANVATDEHFNFLTFLTTQ
ncbi:hypothetical protein [Hyphomicrobium sp. GJ21]|uniref:hypothetical protein n=1 Tax=Hyphomicrobium sp. GJ21 TaxID=113574 RepID=UPI00117AC596|nr:hypothetical protein [Hyphomicrobium sp. GJ21]